MTFDSTKLKIGDVFYQIHEHINSFKNRKEHRVIDGEDWFKYTIPIHTYTISTSKVVGILRKELEGDWTDLEESDLYTKYYVEYEHKKSTQRITIDFYLEDLDNYFFDKDQALARIEILDASAREIDRR
jgi:hypothetical protein